MIFCVTIINNPKNYESCIKPIPFQTLTTIVLITNYALMVQRFLFRAPSLYSKFPVQQVLLVPVRISN